MPTADRRARANFGGESGHAETTAAKPTSTGITLLTARLRFAQRLAVKIDNLTFSGSTRFF
jgi:hypothetical protein